jgi:phosphatidylinositol alpha-mannosyltransferase
VRRFFREHTFDVVHVHEPFVPMLTYYSLWLSPEAVHVATFHMYAESVSPALGAVRKSLGRLLHRSIDRAIAVSRPAEGFARRFWSGGLTVIPNGVPVALFDGLPPEGGSANDVVDSGRPVRLLFVGNWRDERKGLAFLLEAFRRLRREGMALTLDVVGAGPAGRLDHIDGVTFHGAISREEELARHYHRCDVFVSPATGQESFGIVLLEAMAASRAIVCSSIDGYREVVSPEGARFVRAADAESLAEGIRVVALDASLRRRMGAVNRRAAAGYDWERLADRVRGEYVTALGSAGRPAERAGVAGAAEKAEALV